MRLRQCPVLTSTTCAADLCIDENQRQGEQILSIYVIIIIIIIITTTTTTTQPCHTHSHTHLHTHTSPDQFRAVVQQHVDRTGKSHHTVHVALTTANNEQRAMVCVAVVHNVVLAGDNKVVPGALWVAARGCVPPPTTPSQTTKEQRPLPWYLESAGECTEAELPDKLGASVLPAMPVLIDETNGSRDTTASTASKVLGNRRDWVDGQKEVCKEAKTLAKRATLETVAGYYRLARDIDNARTAAGHGVAADGTAAGTTGDATVPREQQLPRPTDRVLVVESMATEVIEDKGNDNHGKLRVCQYVQQIPSPYAVIKALLAVKAAHDQLDQLSLSPPVPTPAPSPRPDASPGTMPFTHVALRIVGVEELRLFIMKWDQAAAEIVLDAHSKMDTPAQDSTRTGQAGADAGAKKAAQQDVALAAQHYLAGSICARSGWARCMYPYKADRRRGPPKRVQARAEVGDRNVLQGIDIGRDQARESPLSTVHDTPNEPDAATSPQGEHAPSTTAASILPPTNPLKLHGMRARQALKAGPILTAIASVRNARFRVPQATNDNLGSSSCAGACPPRCPPCLLIPLFPDLCTDLQLARFRVVHEQRRIHGAYMQAALRGVHDAKTVVFGIMS